MGYLLVILIGVAIIWTIFHFSRKAKKKEEIKDEDVSALKINIPGAEKPKAAAFKPNGRVQESLDALYASSHGMWVWIMFSISLRNAL